MKKIARNIFLLLMIIFIAGCEDKFEELNTDPNKLKDINVSSLLSPILYNSVTSMLGRSHGFTHELMQYTCPIVSNSDGVHRYVFQTSQGNSLWSAYYSNLTNINDMVTICEKRKDNNYLAVALIIRAWYTSIITDAFGDIPYSKASKAVEGTIQPEFDNQQSIYISLLADLENANSLIDVNKPLAFGGDILYGANVKANVVKWKKFANSLRLRLLLRSSGKLADANQKMKDILADPQNYPVFTSTADDAILRFTNITPFDNPFLSSRFRDFSEDWGFSTYFIAKMEEMKDPRFYFWATKSKVVGSVTGYDGIPGGYPESVTYPAGQRSSYVAGLQSSSLIGAMMTFAELEFIKAELALKGVITGDPKALYESGVKASVARWGLTTPAGYFDNTAAAYDGTLNSIIFQKYVNFFFTDYQSWFEKRRTGFPVLPVGPAVQNNQIMPSRLPYPPTVSFYNQTNYEKAIQKLRGTDDINKKVWWNE